MTTKWEYKIEEVLKNTNNLTNKELEEMGNRTELSVLNDAGSEGWELVSVIEEKDVIRNYFKREVGNYIEMKGARLNLPLVQKIQKRIEE